MTQGKRSKRNADGEFARLQLEPQHPHLPAAAPASLLSRKRTGEVRFAALRTTQKKNLRAKWRPRHFAISTGCRGHPCRPPRRRLFLSGTLLPLPNLLRHLHPLPRDLLDPPPNLRLILRR